MLESYYNLPVVLQLVIAFFVTLMLLGAFLFLLRRFSGHQTIMDLTGRGRQNRLGVVERIFVDNKRQLLLVRCDNTEHLLLLGQTDLVVANQITAPNKPATTAPQPNPTPSTPTSTPPQTPPYRPLTPHAVSTAPDADVIALSPHNEPLFRSSVHEHDPIKKNSGINLDRAMADILGRMKPEGKL